MTRKKRKYTRKKKNNIVFYLKKILFLSLLILLFHIIFINGRIIFSNISKSDVILITGDSQQNSKNISSDLENHINTSIELFKKSYAKKILILGDTNIYKINETTLIKNIISENDIWQGNIAYKNSSMNSYPKNTKIFLEENDWESITYVSDFGDYYQNKYNFSQKISLNNIQISYYYPGFFNSISGIFKNYYYWWKI